MIKTARTKKPPSIKSELLKAGAYSVDANFFAARWPQYPFTAQSPTSVKPPLVPGNHMSVRLRVGWRVWGFETKTERDTFIVQFGGLPFP